MRWRTAAIASVGLWLLVLLLAVTQAYVREPAFGWWRTFQSWVPGYLVRAILTAPVLVFIGRTPVPQPPASQLICVHAAASVFWSFLYVVLHAGLILLLWPRTGRHADGLSFLSYLLTLEFLQGLLSYCSVAAVGYAFAFGQHLENERLRSVRMEAGLREAQLSALQRQIDPHFFFNTLHTLSILIDTGQAHTASRLVTRLGELIRSRLRDDTPHQVPLSSEIELLEGYLEIEKARFSGELQVEVILEPGLDDVPVPPFLLQPLVENAIHHGVAMRNPPGRIKVAIQAASGTLRIEIVDNGDGMANSDLPHSGVSLSNLRARLAQLYGGKARLEAGKLDSGGFHVLVELPITNDVAAASVLT